VTVLPITIHLPTEDLSDGTPGAARRVYRSLERGDAVKSTSPSALAYLHAIEAASVDAAVVITPATEFTVMYRSARLAAQLATIPVVVVDSRTAAAGHGLVVLVARDAVSSGLDLEEVGRLTRDAARRVELVATIDSLDLLQRSGRVPPGTVESARQLGIRPLFRLRDGVVERLGIQTSDDAAFDRIRKEWLAGGGDSADQTAVFHAARRKAATQLRSVLGGADYVTEFSPAMGIHTGPGVVGVAWLRSAGV
jgi:DegV family protein with EDD domain